MDFGRGLWVIGVILVLVIVFNVILYYAFSSRSTRHQLRLLSRLMQRAKNPWQSQDETLSELRERVQKLEGGEDADQESPR
jgi:hypothetical protein